MDDEERLNRACALWVRQTYGVEMTGKHWPGDDPQPLSPKWWAVGRTHSEPLDPNCPSDRAHIKWVSTLLRTALDCWERATTPTPEER